MTASTPPKLERTEKKIREASFFLDHLITESEKTTTANPEAFDHYHSAFLTAARSVQDVLKDAAVPKNIRRPTFKSWLKKWVARLTSEEKRLWRSLDKWRNLEVHRRGVKLKEEWEKVPETTVPLSETDRTWAVWYRRSSSAPPGWQETYVYRRTRSYKNKKPVIEECRKQLELQKKLLADFLALHP